MPAHPLQRRDWRNRAACLDEDPELFFPIGTTGTALDQIERAKEVCARCDVRGQCLEWALQTREDQRRAFRRRRRGAG